MHFATPNVCQYPSRGTRASKGERVKGVFPGLAQNPRINVTVARRRASPRNSQLCTPRPAHCRFVCRVNPRGFNTLSLSVSVRAVGSFAHFRAPCPCQYGWPCPPRACSVLHGPGRAHCELQGYCRALLCGRAGGLARRGGYRELQRDWPGPWDLSRAPIGPRTLGLLECVSILNGKLLSALSLSLSLSLSPSSLSDRG